MGTALAARRSLFARRFIPAGKVLERDDIIALRPGVGIPEYMSDRIIGKKSRTDIEKDFLLKIDFFE